MGDATVGLLLLLVAGVTNASFTLPMKFTRRWAWENTWLIWTIFALLLLPTVVTFLTVPRLGDIYAEGGPALILTVAAFGAGWGIAQVLFGLAVEAIGIALTFSIVLGMSAAIGSMIPLIRLHPGEIFSKSGLGVMLGVLLVIVGVVICAIAGRRREAALNAAAQAPKNTSYTEGLSLAIGCGLGAAMVNLGLVFGAPLLASASVRHGPPLGAECGVAPRHARRLNSQSRLLLISFEEKQVLRTDLLNQEPRHTGFTLSSWQPSGSAAHPSTESPAANSVVGAPFWAGRFLCL